MSNPILEIITDEILKSLERDVALPMEFTLNLEPEQFKELIRAGMVNPKTGKQLPDSIKQIYIDVIGIKVLVQSEQAEPKTLDTVH